jgi:SAM-dependent methyltransferase
MDQHSNAGATGAERDLGDLVVEAFGDEWSRFTNEVLTEDELRAMFEDYARIFPWDELPSAAVGFDAGCGSGRWARFVAPRVGVLHCVDASAAALDVARRNLASHDNVVFHHEPLEHLSLADESCDFGYSLGVLHHIPDPLAAARTCVRKLKPGAPFLVYLYYSLSEAGAVTGALFTAVSAGRRLISRLPPRARHAVTDVIAATVYYPPREDSASRGTNR